MLPRDAGGGSRKSCQSFSAEKEMQLLHALVCLLVGKAGHAGGSSSAEGWAEGCSRSWDAKREINHLLISSPPSQRAQRIPGEGFLDASPLGKGPSPSASFPAQSISHSHPICFPTRIRVSVPSSETRRHPSKLQGSSVPPAWGSQLFSAPRHRAITPGSQVPSKKSLAQWGPSTFLLCS